MKIIKLEQTNSIRATKIQHTLTLSYRNEADGIGYDITGDSVDTLASDMDEILDKIWKEKLLNFVLEHPSITEKHIILDECIDDYVKLENDWYGYDDIETDEFIRDVMKIFNVDKIGIVDNTIPSTSLVTIEYMNGDKPWDCYSELMWSPITGEDMNEMFDKWHKEIKDLPSYGNDTE